MDSLREPSRGALADPGAVAFRDVAAVAAAGAVPNADPSADVAVPEDAVACVAEADREALPDHRGLAYDAVAEVPEVHRDLAVVDRSYAVVRAVEEVAHGDSAAAVHVVAVDPAFACDHLDLPVAARADHADAVDLDPEPYAEGPEAVPAVAGTDYAERGKVRGSATVAPLDSALGAEA